ncbi:MAG: hypothetical protein MUO76_22270 [Anaerolineaceae bacterium]|nr:hypothetical protein [Anaerolineaceae bacterium]
MKQIIRYFDDAGPPVLATGSIVFVLFLGLVDHYTGIEFSFSIFYLLPISISSWYVGKNTGIVTSIVSAIVWFIADITAGHIYSSTLYLVWNSIMRLCLFLIISILLSNFKVHLTELHQKELTLQRNRNIVETAQKITAIIAENISVQNSEIFNWIIIRKDQSKYVSERVEKVSTLQRR